MYITTLVGGKRTVIIGVAVAMFASAGVAAAATGAGPWADTPASDTVLVDSGPPAVTVTGDTVSVGSGPVDSVLTGGTDPTATDPASTDPASTDPAVTDPATTDPAITTSGDTVPPPPTSWTPPTSPPGDTYVPLGIALTCVQNGSTISCSWSGVSVPGFSEFLLLRGNGTIGRVPYRTSDPSAGSYDDVNVPPGFYSYVVVALDQNSKNLVHSNPVYVQVTSG